MTHKNYKGTIIDSKHFSDTLIISLGILKTLSIKRKNYFQLLNEDIDIDKRILHEIPYSTYLKDTLFDLVSRGVIIVTDDNHFEITNKGKEIYSNYTLDNLALTAYSNRLSNKSNIISIIVAIIALIVSIISAIIAIIAF